MKTISLSKSLFTSVLLIVLMFFGCKKKEDGKLSITTNPISEITSTSARSGGNVIATGNFTVGMCGVCWSESPSPTTNDYFTTDNQGLGEFSSLLNHLNSGTKYYVRAYATTSSGIMYGEELTFTTETIQNADIIVNTSEVEEISSSTARCGGVVSTNGDALVTQKGVCWSTSSDPTISDPHTADGQGTGAFTSNVTGLTGSTLYYIRAYATTSENETFYGNSRTFMTDAGNSSFDLPTITIGELTDITGNSAKCTGNVVADGGTEVTQRGFCWNTSPHPLVYYSHVECGSGVGGFSGNLTDLEPGTTYYVRAYATNSEGTNYNEEDLVFTTISLPSVITSEATNVTRYSATVGGDVTDDGGSAVIRGICWNTTGDPTISDNPMICGNGTGTFSVSMNGLEPNTTYYVNAFAKNEAGTAYGNPISFTTTSTEATLDDFLGVYSVRAYNNDARKYDTWSGTKISTFNNSNTNSTWVKVEGIMSGEGYKCFTALGEYSEEHHAIRLYSGWHFTGSDYQFYFNDEPDVLYYALFYPICHTAGTTWYYVEDGYGYEGAGEAWLRMEPDGTVSLGPSEYPDENDRYANGFVMDYRKVEDDSYVGRFECYTEVKLTKTSKLPMDGNEQSETIGSPKHVAKEGSRTPSFNSGENANPIKTLIR